ncbi:sulfotransferase family protein [Ignicoccus hospitalis]|uniref:Sulfotransferase n=1 Tax=Ignicoccus hospitalis (strain KIN4/I / DSM 18386 / JCM 14125) TaxID=453591 RepID=A8AAX6_IGNH4|nr:sulfotransferase family protein [Ignicoccus hospitalis]ABU82078.1 hypothetical protein Igni_0898 [Ignicoccus hospitalis KIN4/I]HIH91036.1 sulfotransferase family protein [Desulfurococcaceae archaeon]
MVKPILINGFPRSGTTYLFRYLQWKFGEALFEPLTSPQVAVEFIKDERLKRDLLIKNPWNVNASFYRSWWIYDTKTLEEFKELVKGIPLKEVTLHFYLDLFQDGWEVYHIIRHPADNYFSYVNYFYGGRGFGRKLAFSALKGLAKLGFDSHKFFALWEMATRICPISSYSKIRRSFEAAFVYMWTVANWTALKTLGERRILVYEKPETLETLPEFREFSKNNPFKKKTYEGREKLFKKFDALAREVGVGEEFELLMELMR